MSEQISVICIIGKAHSGKDTAGKMIADASDGVVLAFADKLKAICAEMFGLSREDLYTEDGKNRKTNLPSFRCPSPGCGSFRVLPWKPDDAPRGFYATSYTCEACGTVGEKKLFVSSWTPRMILQHVGTEGFRAISPNVWADYALRVARRELLKGKRLVVFTDGRFRSECERVWQAGGEVWRIKRDGATGNVGIMGHASETEQDNIRDDECQVVIENNGTLGDLQRVLQTSLGQFWTRRP